MRVGTEAFTHERDAGKALPRQSFMLQKDKREVSVSRGPTATTSTYKCSFQTRHSASQLQTRQLRRLKKGCSARQPHAPRTPKTCARGRGAHLIKLGFSNL